MLWHFHEIRLCTVENDRKMKENRAWRALRLGARLKAILMWVHGMLPSPPTIRACCTGSFLTPELEVISFSLLVQSFYLYVVYYMHTCTIQCNSLTINPLLILLIKLVMSGCVCTKLHRYWFCLGLRYFEMCF